MQSLFFVMWQIQVINDKCKWQIQMINASNKYRYTVWLVAVGRGESLMWVSSARPGGRTAFLLPQIQIQIQTANTKEKQSVSGTGACLRTTISDLMDSLYHVELNLSCEGQLCWETRRTVEAGWPLLLLLRIWPVDLSQPQGLVLTARPNVTVTNIIILINANTKIIIPRNASLMMD